MFSRFQFFHGKRMKRMTKIALWNKCVCFLLFLFIDVYQISVEVRQTCAIISQNFREMCKMRGCVVCSTASMTSHIARVIFHCLLHSVLRRISIVYSLQFQCFHFHIHHFTTDPQIAFQGFWEERSKKYVWYSIEVL